MYLNDSYLYSFYFLGWKFTDEKTFGAFDTA